jgi:hypothetical protein
MPAFDASTLKRPAQVYDFTSFSQRTPTQQIPGDRVDAQFANHAEVINALVQAITQLTERLGDLALRPQPQTRSTPLPHTPALYVNAGGPYASDVEGSDATAADYAQVSIEWAEHMPDTIPPNILAINAITGDHWSSRWWANRAAQLVASLGVVGSIGGQGVFAEALTVTARNTVSALTRTPAGPVLLLVNGQGFLPVGAPPFAVVGRTIQWLSTIYSLNVGDDVAVWYPFAAPPPNPAPPPPTGNPVTLYYIATQGQTVFPVTVGDYYGNSFRSIVGALRVARNGVRLMPDGGSGVGGYTVGGSVVTLLQPAGAGEQITIDVWGVGGAPSTSIVLGTTQEALTVTAPNVLSPLSRVPDGRAFTLTVQGRPFFAVGPTPAFTYAGTTVTWTSTTFSLASGMEVIASYTTASS